jgi:protein-disulfide isomerase/type II secretory pathway component PulC
VAYHVQVLLRLSNMRTPSPDARSVGRRRLAPAKLAAVVAIPLALAACDSGDGSASGGRPAAADPSFRRAAPGERTVALIDETEITLDDIEAPLRIQVHELAMQRFRLLRGSLFSATAAILEASQGESHVARLSLEPPLPPRMLVEFDPARVRPSAEAPVTIVAFCNFESPHCARLQITLSTVLSLYPGVVRFAALDLPLAFHRNAGRAAEAARCALEQGNYWRFYDALYASSGVLDDQRLMVAARAALLDLGAFETCLGSERRAGDVAADAAQAARLNVSSIPAVFVNGLYASPEVESADLIWLIEQELERLGVSTPRPSGPAERSTAPFLVRALLPSDYAGQGAALLAPALAPDDVELIREGTVVGQSIIVARVTADGVVLLEGGKWKWLALTDTADRQSDLAPTTNDGGDEPPIVTPHRAVPVTLDRDEVLVRLADRTALQRALTTVPMRAGDYRQLRVTEVAPGSVYELLGIEPGDVLLGVNEKPIHEADNPLWEALETEDEVRLRVMRRGGVAHHYTYRFSE